MEQAEKSYSKLEWFFYIIFLPLLFTVLLTVILLYFMGYDTLNTALKWGNSVPVVERVLPEPKPEPGEMADQASINENRVKDLRTENAQKEQTITELRSEVQAKEQSIKELENQIEELNASLEEKKTDEDQRQQEIGQLAQLYASMRPGNVAPILENLTMNEAVLMLEAMSNNDRSDILSEMNPQTAADLSILLKDTQLNKDDDIAALQKRIQVLTEALSEMETNTKTVDELVQTFTSMPPANASNILRQMMSTTPDKALTIMANINSNVRSRILSAMANEDADLAARITQQLIE